MACNCIGCQICTNSHNEPYATVVFLQPRYGSIVENRWVALSAPISFFVLHQQRDLYQSKLVEYHEKTHALVAMSKTELVFIVPMEV